MKNTDNITLNGKRLNIFPLHTRNKRQIPALFTFLREKPKTFFFKSQGSKTRNKKNPDWKEKKCRNSMEPTGLKKIKLKNS